MKTNPETLTDLLSKIDWEGGLVEYVCGYGGDMPDELSDAVNNLKQAVSTLENDFGILLKNHNVEEL